MGALGLTFQATLDGRRWFGRGCPRIRSRAVGNVAEALRMREEALDAERSGQLAVGDLWSRWSSRAKPLLMRARGGADAKSKDFPEKRSTGTTGDVRRPRAPQSPAFQRQSSSRKLARSARASS